MKVKLNFAHPISELDMLNLIATSEMEQMVHDLVIYKIPVLYKFSKNFVLPQGRSQNVNESLQSV